jgi:hypothetical protein
VKIIISVFVPGRSREVQIHFFSFCTTRDRLSFIPVIFRTLGSLHSKSVHLLFLQTHRETDRFLTDSGVQFVESNYSGQFYNRRRFRRGRRRHVTLKFSTIGRSVTGTIVDYSQLGIVVFCHRQSHLGPSTGWDPCKSFGWCFCMFIIK